MIINIKQAYKPSKYYIDLYPRENITEAFIKVIEIVKVELDKINKDVIVNFTFSA